jgi:hypothetical protein
MVGDVVVIKEEVNGVREGEANSASPPQGDAGVQDHRAERRVAGGGYEENLRMTFAMTTGGCQWVGREGRKGERGLTVQRDDAEDEDDGQRHHDDRVDFQPGGLVRVEP